MVTRAHYALGLQHVLFLKLSVQGPECAHFQAVGVAMEGQTLPCHQAEGDLALPQSRGWGVDCLPYALPDSVRTLAP